jgi:adenylosuccinate synthase
MTTYDELPIELKEYIEFIEREVEVPIKIVSVVVQTENKLS